MKRAVLLASVFFLIQEHPALALNRPDPDVNPFDKRDMAAIEGELAAGKKFQESIDLLLKGLKKIESLGSEKRAIEKNLEEAIARLIGGRFPARLQEGLDKFEERLKKALEK